LDYQPATDYKTVFNAMQGASALLLPDSPLFTVVAATDEFTAFAGTTRESLINNSIFRYFPDNPDVPNVSDNIRASFEKCLESGKKSELPVQRYDIANSDGTFQEMYWTVTHTPILDVEGDIVFIIHTAANVTHSVLSDIKDEKLKSFQLSHNLLMQSSVAIHIFNGPEFIVELANAQTLKSWDKDKSVIGKPLLEILPELKNSNYPEILKNILLTGIPYEKFEAPIILHRGGRDETCYFNMVLQPYYNDKKIRTGVIAMTNDVTDVYNDRKALAEKERSLELAVEIGHLGTFNINLGDQTVNYSPQIMQWLSSDKQSMPLSELLKIIYTEDRIKVLETLSQISQSSGSGRKHDLTFRVLNPVSGQIQYLRSIGQIFMEDGEPVVLSGIIQDTTRSVLSRMALEGSAQRLKSFIDSAPFPMGVYIGKEMRIEMVNQAILDAWDKDNSVIGKCFAEVLPELMNQGIYEQLDGVYTTGKAFHAHHQRVDLEVGGELQSFYFNYSFTPLFDALGNVYGVMNTGAEVTDLIVAQKALKQSERNFRTMILQAPVAMGFLEGPDHVVSIANSALIELWGKEEVDVIDKPVFKALPDAKEQGLEQLLSHVFHAGETITANERPITLLRFGKTETLFLNFVYEPYRDGNDVISGVLCIAVDVTDQVVARFKIEEMVAERTEELELSNINLQKSNAELEQFAYIASHDLQEPLRKINMFTGMLQRVIGNDATALRHMDNITSSVNRMTNLIRDILSYSQLSQKQESFEKINLDEIFTEAIADFDLVLEEKKAGITHIGLPTIDAIPLQMIQLFHNLISNALKYSKPDVPPVVTITGQKLSTVDALEFGFLTKVSEPYYSITFEDNGIGFAQEYADKIFNIFQRLHAKGKYDGTGIGLAMCRKIAENHNGIIYAESSEGVGAKFVIILPSVQIARV